MKGKKSNAIMVLGVVFFVLLAFLIYLLSNNGGLLENGGEENGKALSFGSDLVDSEGNSYKTLEVGDMVWMAENLNTKTEHGNTWCYNDNEVYCEQYGRLYDWEAAMGVEGDDVCPDGWSVPTDVQWYDLESFFATGSCDGSRLDWGCFPAAELMKTESWGGDDENKFAVLPAGFIDREGRSSFLTSYSYFWTSSKVGDSVWRRGFLDTQSNILRNTENPEFGYSVRCIKNN